MEDLYPEQELPLGEGDSIEIELGPHWLEPSEQEIQDYVQEMRERSTLLDTSDTISGFSSNSQENKRFLGVVGECMLQSWFQPVHGSVWSEHKVFERLKNLLLVPKQQSSVDSGVRVN